MSQVLFEKGEGGKIPALQSAPNKGLGSLCIDCIEASEMNTGKVNYHIAYFTPFYTYMGIV